MRVFPVPAAALLACVCFFAACRTRGFHADGGSRPRSSGGAPSSASSAPTPSAAAAADLARIEEAEREAGALDDIPKDYVADAYADTYVLDGQTLRVGDTLDVGRYAREVLPKLSRANKVPRRLAARTVLGKLEEMRDRFSRVGVEGVAKEAPGLPALAGKVDFTKMVDDRGKPLVPPMYEMEALNTFNSYCKDLSAAHFSDIQYHYYCLIPPVYRACHREVLAKHDSLVNTKKEVRDRREAIDLCLKDPATLSDEEKGFVGKYAAFAPLFKAFYETQWVEPTPGAPKVNVFDYILLSQTFGFDYDDQQAVLNTFYGQQKPASAGAWNPLDAADCEALRPRRSLDDDTGRHCDAKAPKRRAWAGIGR